MDSSTESNKTAGIDYNYIDETPESWYKLAQMIA